MGQWEEPDVYIYMYSRHIYIYLQTNMDRFIQSILYFHIYIYTTFPQNQIFFWFFHMQWIWQNQRRVPLNVYSVYTFGLEDTFGSIYDLFYFIFGFPYVMYRKTKNTNSRSFRGKTKKTKPIS